MDRVDLFINVPQLKYEKLTAPDEENSSQKIRERVERARNIQRERFWPEKSQGQKQSLTETVPVTNITNAEMIIPQIKKYCQIGLKSQNLLRNYVDSGRLSARGYHRVLKVARTIADLENSENILDDHLSEALMYRIREEQS